MSAQTSIGANDGRIQTAVTLAETGPFTIDYPFFSLDDNVITITSAAGTITTYTRGVDYTIAATANDDGIYPSGTVTWLGAGIPVAGTLTRYRVTSLTRASQLPLTGYLDRTSVNADLNKQIMALQDQLRIGYGTIRFPEEDGNAAADKILPPESQAPNTALLFDASGNPYYGTLASGVIPTSAFMATVLDDASAGAARTTLGVPSTAEAILQSLIDAEGDLIIGTAADTVARLARGTAGQSLGVTSNRPAWKTPQVRGHLSGLALSTAGSSATFDIAEGMAADSTNAAMMALSSAYTKTTSAWALGTAAGSLDTGAIANSTWYHVYLIQRVDTGVVDVLLSLSATAPTMPAGYTLFRRIGSMQTNGSAQWVKFNQHGDRFDRLAVSDFTISGTSAATLRTLSVPTGVVVLPICSAVVQAVNNTATIVQVAPAADATLLVNAAYAYEGAAAEGSNSGTYFYAPPTNTSGQIYVAVPNYSSGSSLFTSGWIDRRGQDA